MRKMSIQTRCQKPAGDARPRSPVRGSSPLFGDRASCGHRRGGEGGAAVIERTRVRRGARGATWPVVRGCERKRGLLRYKYLFSKCLVATWCILQPRALWRTVGWAWPGRQECGPGGGRQPAVAGPRGTSTRTSTSTSTTNPTPPASQGALVAAWRLFLIVLVLVLDKRCLLGRLLPLLLPLVLESLVPAAACSAHDPHLSHLSRLSRVSRVS